MQSFRSFQRMVQNEGVTPWQGEDTNFFTFKPQKQRNFSQPSSKMIKFHSPSSDRNMKLIQNLSKKQRLAKIDKRLLAKTQTINFEMVENQRKCRGKLIQKTTERDSSPFLKVHRTLNHHQSSFRKLRQLRNDRCHSTDLYKSKFNPDFCKIESIKRKELVLNTNKNFFQPIERRNEKYSNRVTEMLSIIRRVMHKEGAIGKIIKKRQRPKIKSGLERVFI